MHCQIQNPNSKHYGCSQLLPHPNLTAKDNSHLVSFSLSKKDKTMPATEATLQDLSQDLLKQMNVKNKLLSSQLQEYKLLVRKMESKITELNRCVGDLRRQLEQNKINNEFREEQMQKTVPLHQLMARQINRDNVFTLEEVINIIKRQAKTDGEQWGRREVELQLQTMADEHREMQVFVQNIWRMKDRVEPGRQVLLAELWSWVVKLGVNYHQLMLYKKDDTKITSNKKKSVLQDQG